MNDKCIAYSLLIIFSNPTLIYSYITVISKLFNYIYKNIVIPALSSNSFKGMI